MSTAPTQPRNRPVALTIAGSDSGGGAGIQADLRVFHRLGVFGTSAIAALTAQNLREVRSVAGVEPDFVRAQIDTVLAGFEVRAAKTGMLWSAPVVEAVVQALTGAELSLVVDPVMVATSGATLLEPAAIAGYRERLLPIAAVITPNLDEAAVLLERPTIAPDEQVDAADQLYRRFGVPVLLKGGHLAGDPVDVLRHPAGTVSWRHPRIDGVDSHGSGCMLAAAIAAHFALGDGLVDACEAGLCFVHDALARPCRLPRGELLADVELATVDRSVLRRPK